MPVSPLSAALAVAADHGLPTEDARVLRDLTNVLVHTSPAPVVARVPITLAHLRDRDWLAQEIRQAGFLAERGAPVAPPATVVDPGPHEHGDRLVCFWAYLEHDPERFDPTAAGRSLRDLHRELGLTRSPFLPAIAWTRSGPCSTGSSRARCSPWTSSTRSATWPRACVRLYGSFDPKVIEQLTPLPDALPRRVDDPRRPGGFPPRAAMPRRAVASSVRSLTRERYSDSRKMGSTKRSGRSLLPRSSIPWARNTVARGSEHAGEGAAERRSYNDCLDWSLFHLLNGLLRGDDPSQDIVEQFSSVSIPAFAVATCLLWFFARPAGSLRLKLATASALAAAGLGLLINQAIGQLWFRDRPYTAHPHATLLLAHPSHDPSFPSDHATAAFAIAFAVCFFSRRVGALFLLAAVLVGVSRILMGLHYPGDVAAGAAIGLFSAVVVAKLGRRYIELIVRQLSRLSDPLVATATRWMAAAWRRPG